MARLCEPSWLENYLEYTRNQESPEIFHLWTGVAMLSAALGRNVWINRGFYQLYPNHYIILLADSAEYRKSVAVGIGRDLLDKSKVVAISAERITNADILMQLGKLSNELGRAELFIWADELKTFLSLEETHKGIITTLTRLYACPSYFENRTKTAGVDHLVNCCVNLLAATTPTDFGEIIPGAATGSGFVPRLHIIHGEDKRDRVPWPLKEPELERKLAEDLKQIRKNLSGEYKLQPEAKEWWDEWYTKVFEYPEDMQLNGFYGRKPDYVLKLGMVIAASNRDELHIEKKDLTTALTFLDQMEATMGRAYQVVGTTPSLKYMHKVLEQIKKRGGKVKRSDLLHMNWAKMSAQELTEVCQYLEETGLIEVIPTMSGRGVVYRLRQGAEVGVEEK